MELLIDDLRELRCDVVARTYTEGFEQLKSQKWTCLILDHDLGESRNGYDLIKEVYSIDPDLIPPRIEIVSSNPVGVNNIGNFLSGIGYQKRDFNGRVFEKTK